MDIRINNTPQKSTSVYGNSNLTGILNFSKIGISLNASSKIHY